MTATVTTVTARQHIANALANPTVRRAVASTVGRGLPPLEAEDVVQAVFCEALDARALPSDPLEIPYWLVGIARHKVVDFYRRRRRDNAPRASETALEPPPFEAREGLARVLESAQDERTRQTLSWLVREHDGEALSEIAASESIAPAAVRQRVSRLRRALRRDFAYLLGALLFLGGSGAAAVHHRAANEASIRAETTNRLDALDSALDGEFVVESIDPAADLDFAERALLETEARGARIVVQGSRLQIRSTTFDTIRTFESVAKTGSLLHVVLADEAGHKDAVDVRRTDVDRISVSSTSSRFRGTLILRRLD